MWLEPVTNRTALDKGYLTFEVLNRIEGNCSYIAEQLFLYGYQIEIEAKTDWSMNDFPYAFQINRIRNNINTLIDAYHKLDGSPDIRYWNSLDWQDVNSLEQNLFNLNDILERMKNSFKYCGTFNAGEEVV
jgi:hypothetical protein